MADFDVKELVQEVADAAEIYNEAYTQAVLQLGTTLGDTTEEYIRAKALEVTQPQRKVWQELNVELKKIETEALYYAGKGWKANNERQAKIDKQIEEWEAKKNEDN